ncbi:DUF4013 domain-containing protein [Haloarcula sp. S1CR25-12]|uniref:DUF4013 domain-containing protein n=1 Tax=Haloarcula saliterrae TaxID=2950534 RepID=A0ABU2F730_9EURY|nr:DUF4013 domain-containing protein [Haloarcula sp. S1CR25-12]MDS0258077.1 DUF4013 domain-containing protein [Haloarcula sp. S1CR25-12]
MQGESWIGRMLIGGLLVFFAFFIIPIFFFQGYLLRVLGSSVRGDPEPPAWEDWGGLFVDGLKATVVAFVYALVPTIVFLGIGGVLVGIGGAAGDSGGGIIAGFGILTALLFIPVLLLVYYLVPAALANMAVEGSIGAAFDFEMISNVVLSVDYLVAVLMPIVVGVLLNIVSFLLGITIVGYLLVPFITFYGQVAIFRMFGLAFAKQSNKGPQTAASAATGY